MIKYALLFLFAQTTIAQTVTTFFTDASRDVDDAMVFDTTGNLYGSNFNGDTVYKITPEGVATPFVDSLQNPNGLAFDDAGNLYVAEYSANRINKYDVTGNLIDSFPTGGLTSGLIKDVNSDGFIYTNVSDDSVNSLGLDGTIVQLYQGAPLVDPVGLAFDDSGTLFVGNFTGRMIHKLAAGVATYVATVPNGNALGFITYAGGNLYGTNFSGHEIYVINPNGVDDIQLYAGSSQGADDGPIGSATFNTPNGIIYNASQNALYVSEFSGDGNIRRISDAVLDSPDFELPAPIALYPNPAKSEISIESNTTAITSLVVFDMIGKIVYTQAYEATQRIALDITELNSGVYLLQIETEKGTHSRRLVKD